MLPRNHGILVEVSFFSHGPSKWQPQGVQRFTFSLNFSGREQFGWSKPYSCHLTGIGRACGWSKPSKMLGLGATLHRFLRPQQRRKAALLLGASGEATPRRAEQRRREGAADSATAAGRWGAATKLLDAGDGRRGNSPSLLLEAPPLPRIPCSWRPRLLCSYVSDGWRGCGLTVDVEGASPAPERDGDGAPARDGDIGILNLYVQMIFTSWISHHMIDPHMSNTISLLFHTSSRLKFDESCSKHLLLYGFLYGLS